MVFRFSHFPMVFPWFSHGLPEGISPSTASTTRLHAACMSQAKVRGGQRWKPCSAQRPRPSTPLNHSWTGRRGKNVEHVEKKTCELYKIWKTIWTIWNSLNCTNRTYMNIWELFKEKSWETSIFIMVLGKSWETMVKKIRDILNYWSNWWFSSKMWRKIWDKHHGFWRNKLNKPV